MLKEAKQILKYIEEHKDAGNMLPLLLEQQLRKIIKQDRYNGTLIRALDDNRLHIVHGSAHMKVQQDAGNSCIITLTPYKEKGKPVKASPS